MKKFNTKSLDDLEKGIKQLLLEDRCSFLEEEVNLLNDCIVALQMFRSSIEKEGKPDLAILIKIAQLLIQLFNASDHLKELF